MDNRDFDIEMQDTPINESNSIQLPLNFLSFGEIENDDVKVYIKQDVYKALEKLSASDTSKELGSIILGEYSEELGKTHVVISDYIEAKYTDASASTLTFTHETWDYIHKEHERLYPTKKIIGWQHTHPNYGIFLSNYDMFIQENFFNMPFQVAYVIDPIQNIRGFFQWKNGKIEKLKGYYVYDEIGKPIKIEQKKIVKENAPAPRSNKALISIVSVLCAVCLVLTFSLFSLRNDYQERIEKQDEIVGDINALLNEQKEIIDKQSAEISTLQQYFVDGILDSSGTTTAKDLIEKIENHEIELENQDSLLAELKSYIEQDSTENTVSFTIYTVQSGDSLSSICSKNGIDYAANLKIILAMNGIEDANRIFVGQNILLPTVHNAE